MENRIKIGITHGDINGIGYELIIKTLIDNRIMDLCTPIVYGSPKVAAYHRKALNVPNFSFNNINRIDEANPKRANIINCMTEDVKVDLGISTDFGGDGSIASLDMAIADLKNKKIDALVTAPVNKNNIKLKQGAFNGHTEYLAEAFGSKDCLMLMVSNIMKVGVVTGHVPLRRVTELITQDSIYSKLKVLNTSLKNDFGIKKPRIAVLGLNPHAGDDGLLGNEDKEIILPVIDKARNEGILAVGPYSADGFFGAGSYSGFDAVLAMYHDQGMLPFKVLSFEDGVNFTAGLPIVRTSPVHGTAFEIAGMNKASEASFRNAIYMACDICRHRKHGDHREVAVNQSDPPVVKE